MKVSVILHRALESKKLRTLKEASKFLGISPELLRMILIKEHLPKDKTLARIARSLGLNGAALIHAAHQERLPSTAKQFLLAPQPSPYREGKRVFPLSQEQCDYLCKMMTPAEIQLIRKYRQVSEEAKISIRGYIEYTFALKRQPPPPQPAATENPASTAENPDAKK